MTYIRQLRQLVGTRPLVLAGACALVMDARGSLLMLRRTDNGCWGIPGGALEPGESTEQTVRRETLEETSLTLGPLELFGVFSGPELFYHYPNGDQVYNVTIAYTCSSYTGSIACSDGEHDRYAFFQLSALPANTSPSIQPILKALLDARARWPII